MPWLMHLCHLLPDYVRERMVAIDLIQTLDWIDAEFLKKK